MRSFRARHKEEASGKQMLWLAASATLTFACGLARERRPYQGLRRRSIKALFDEEQADLGADEHLGASTENRRAG